MGNHPFNVVVVLFWFATMSWLVVAKILPPMLIGEPPTYQTILQESQDEDAVCWSICLQDRVIGWAATKIMPGNDGITNLYSRVYLGELPLEELAPGWLSAVLKGVISDLGRMDIDKRSRVTIDPLGRLVSFESRVRVAEILEAIKVDGEVVGNALKLTMQSGDIASSRFERYLSQDTLVADEFAPNPRMPGLRVGQSWTVPVYSPFRPQNSPMEILQASVDEETTITWDNKPQKCRMIVYRNDSGSPLAANENRGRVWVREDGLVLRQEVAISRSRLHFIRLGEEKTEVIRQALGEDWTEGLPGGLAKRVLRKVNDESP